MKINKTIIFSFLGSALLLGSLLGGFFYYKSKNQVIKTSNLIKEENIKKQNTPQEVFPEWSPEMLNEYVIIEKNKNIFNKNVIAFFIQQTLKRLRVSQKSLKYKYKFNEQLTEFTIWLELKITSDYIARKKYHFSIDVL
ncbi:MHO_1590 family protein [Mycoplasmopsis alligatoris]|uniref:Uncharacterized protein n=1 Tax=Mycoplasmopsis alligatoris A21JP2 TaxID=747682 RepID=D4XWT0_9BACT|nr:hypothetical protein [Mycoplasmopsis alligatoris]EFF41285.1 hypothetical protein MALL_0347 [Mycoplasmopsis alligatoris A21JP2]